MLGAVEREDRQPVLGQLAHDAQQRGLERPVAGAARRLRLQTERCGDRGLFDREQPELAQARGPAAHQRLGIELVDAEHVAQHLLDRRQRRLAQLRRERRHVQADVVTGEPEPPHRLRQEPRLARARLAVQADHLQLTLVRATERLADLAQLDAAADEATLRVADTALAREQKRVAVGTPRGDQPEARAQRLLRARVDLDLPFAGQLHELPGGVEQHVVALVLEQRAREIDGHAARAHGDRGAGRGSGLGGGGARGARQLERAARGVVGVAAVRIELAE